MVRPLGAASAGGAAAADDEAADFMDVNDENSSDFQEGDGEEEEDEEEEEEEGEDYYTLEPERQPQQKQVGEGGNAAGEDSDYGDSDGYDSVDEPYDGVDEPYDADDLEAGTDDYGDSDDGAALETAAASAAAPHSSDGDSEARSKRRRVQERSSGAGTSDEEPGAAAAASQDEADSSDPDAQQTWVRSRVGGGAPRLRVFGGDDDGGLEGDDDGGHGDAWLEGDEGQAGAADEYEYLVDMQGGAAEGISEADQSQAGAAAHDSDDQEDENYYQLGAAGDDAAGGEGDSGSDDNVFEGNMMEVELEPEPERGVRRRPTQRVGSRGGAGGAPRRKFGKLSPQVEALLGRANRAFMAGDGPAAMATLREVVKLAPHHPEPYRMLATVAAERGDAQLELEFNMCICGLDKQDAEQYKHTLVLAERCDDGAKQDECLRRLCALEPLVAEHAVDRGALLARLERPLNAAAVYRAAIKRLPTNADLYFGLSELCRTSQLARLQNLRLELLAGLLAMLVGREYTRAAVLSLASGWHVSDSDAEARRAPDAVFSAAMQLADVLMTPRQPYASIAADVLAGVEEWTRDYQQDLLTQGATDAQREAALMPLDLATKLGICYVHLDNMELAHSCFRTLLQQDPADDLAGRLMALVTEAMMSTKHCRDVVPLLSKMATSNSPRRWYAFVRMGEAQAHLGETEAANTALKEVLERWPGHCGALIAFSALHRQSKDALLAEAALGALHAPVMQLVHNQLKPAEACAESVGVSADCEDALAADMEADMEADPGGGGGGGGGGAIRIIIATGPWQKLQLLLEYGQLARAAGRPKDQLTVLLPVLDQALRQIKTAPIMVLRNKWTKAKARSEAAAAAGAGALPSFAVACSWQTQEQRDVAAASGALAAALNLQKLMGPTLIANLVRDAVRALVSIGRRKDANALVRAVNRVSGLPMSAERREALAVLCAFRGRAAGFGKGSRGGAGSTAAAAAKRRTPRLAPRSSDDDDSSDGGGGGGSEDERERRECREVTERAAQSEVYFNKVAALKADPTNTALWNELLPNLYAHKTSLRRRLDVLVGQFPNCAMPWLVQGNAMNASARLKQALACYATAVAKEPRQSLPYLCLGMCLVRLVSNTRRTPDFHECAVKAVASLTRYAELRIEEEQAEHASRQDHTASADPADGVTAAPPPPATFCRRREALYNLGRAYHQLGVMHLAEKFYWRAMAAPPPGGAGLPVGATAVVRMAAYNLSRLYQEVGSLEMARDVVSEYLAVG